MNARLWPDTKAVVIVIELDPEHLPEAIGDLQRFLSAHRLNAPEDQMLYGPTLHVAIEDVAEAVLQHFASAPLIDEDVAEEVLNSPYLERPHVAGCSLDDNHRGMCLRGTRVGN